MGVVWGCGRLYGSYNGDIDLMARGNSDEVRDIGRFSRGGAV